MASRPTRPALRERYDRRRQEVVVGAARVFARQGFDRTPVPELAQALGIAAGGLYHYFGGKEQLLVAICDQLMDPLLEQAEELLAEDAAPEAQLRALVRLWVGHVITRRDHMLVFQQVRHVIDHGGQGDQWRVVRERRKRFERLVERLLAGVLEHRPPLERRLALSALLGMVNHTAQWYRPKGALTAEQIADGYVDLVLRARAWPAAA